MGKFLIKVALFLAIVAGVDRLAGFAFKSLEHSARGGFTKRDSFICDKLETDVLIMGSSRCVRHYNPQIVSDSLGLSCYNAGQMGNGIILNYGRLKMIKERKQPSVLIYDLHPEFDLLVGEDNQRYLTWLKSHYERDGIAEIFESIDKTEKYKMQSRMYRYNSKWVEMMIDYLHPIADARDDGFSPLKGEIDKMKLHAEEQNETDNNEFDKLKIKYLEAMMEESANSRLFIVVSPIWYGMDTLQFAPVKELCQKRGIPFIDFSNNPKYVGNNEFFKNGSHMNENGADEFTRDLIEFIK
jgi:hypothetical protein